MAVAFLGCLWIAATIQVEASGRCPAASEIEVKLEPLLARAGVEGPARRATIVEDRGELAIRLAELDGTVVAEKRLPTGGSASCAVLAETAAVVVATWDARLRSGVALAIDSPVGLPAPGPYARSSAAPATPRAGAAVATLPAYRPPERFASTVFAAVYLDAPALGPAVKAGVRIGATSGLGAQVSFGAAGPDHAAIANGETRWGRTALGFGPSWALGTRAWRARLAAEGTVGLLLADGVGFDETQRRWGVDVGGTLGASIGRRFGRVTPYLGAELWGWARNHVLTVAGATEVTRPPRAQLWVGAGLAWGATP